MNIFKKLIMCGGGDKEHKPAKGWKNGIYIYLFLYYLQLSITLYDSICIPYSLFAQCVRISAKNDISVAVAAAAVCFFCIAFLWGASSILSAAIDSTISWRFLATTLLPCTYSSVFFYSVRLQTKFCLRSLAFSSGSSAPLSPPLFAFSSACWRQLLSVGVSPSLPTSSTLFTSC